MYNGKLHNGGPKIKALDEAAKKKPTILGWIFVACLAAAVVMLTIKLGVVLFT